MTKNQSPVSAQHSASLRRATPAGRAEAADVRALGYLAGEWAALQDRAVVVCAERGMHLTQLRQSVLRELWMGGAPQGAYELACRLKSRAGGRLAANSVYRALAFLQDLGFVRRLESRHAYIVAPAGGESGNVMLLCDGCDTVTTVSDPELAAKLTTRSETLGFHPTRQIIEVAGSCQDCRRKARNDG